MTSIVRFGRPNLRAAMAERMFVEQFVVFVWACSARVSSCVCVFYQDGRVMNTTQRLPISCKSGCKRGGVGGRAPTSIYLSKGLLIKIICV